MDNMTYLQLVNKWDASFYNKVKFLKYQVGTGIWRITNALKARSSLYNLPVFDFILRLIKNKSRKYAIIERHSGNIVK